MQKSASDVLTVRASVPGARFRVGCCAYSYRHRLQAKTNPITLYDFLEECAALNMDGVELTAYYFPQPLTASEIHKIARKAFLLGLEVAGAAVGNSFCLPPGPDRDRNLALVKQWLDYSVDMGARSLRVFAGGPPQGVTAEQGRKWVIECLQECLPHAETRGVILALENHGGVTADAAGTLAILDAVPSDWIGLKLDTGNFQTADPYADLAQAAKFAISTHIKTDMLPGGEKQPADLARVLSILRAAHYRGYLLLEYEADEDPAIAIPETIAALQRLSV